MLQAAGSLAAIAVLVVAGVLLARRGWLGEPAVRALTALITRLTLPLLLFRAFLQLAPDGRNAVLAAVVFGSCALMGLIGAGLARAVRLPSPETRLLFQGFEAGMLGYALYAALHPGHLPAFAALDVGQVVYVFTALLVQMRLLDREPSEQSKPSRPSSVLPWRDIVTNPVIWAIVGGVTLSLAAPGFAASLAGPGTVVAPLFDVVGGLTTPLVSLVIGASLAQGVPRDPAIVTVVALRTAVGLGLGLLVGLVLVPALGFDSWHAKAAVMLFVLPAPFVIPVYHRRGAAFVGSVLTLSTAVSVLLVAVLVVLGVA